MRVVDYGVKEEYQPLCRGEAFPQFYENGDRFRWSNPMCWNYRFWLEGCHHKVGHRLNDFDPTWLMGGEL